MSDYITNNSFNEPKHSSFFVFNKRYKPLINCHLKSELSLQDKIKKYLSFITNGNLEEIELLEMILTSESKYSTSQKYYLERHLVNILLRLNFNKPLKMSIGVCQTRLPPLKIILANSTEPMFARYSITRNELITFLKEKKLKTVYSLIKYSNSSAINYQDKIIADKFLNIARLYVFVLNNNYKWSIKEALRRLRLHRKYFDYYLKISGEKYNPRSKEYKALLLMAYNRSPLRIVSGAIQKWAKDITKKHLKVDYYDITVDAKIPLAICFLIFKNYADKHSKYFSKVKNDWKIWEYYSRNRIAFLKSKHLSILKKLLFKDFGYKLNLIPSYAELLDKKIIYANYGVRALYYFFNGNGNGNGNGGNNGFFSNR